VGAKAKNDCFVLGFELESENSSRYTNQKWKQCLKIHNEKLQIPFFVISRKSIRNYRLIIILIFYFPHKIKSISLKS